MEGWEPPRSAGPQHKPEALHEPCIRPVRLRSPRLTAQSRAAKQGWEADERPEPRSLGLLPSGPDPVGEWLVHRQPPVTYIGRGRAESKRASRTATLPRLPASALLAARLRVRGVQTFPQR